MANPAADDWGTPTPVAAPAQDGWGPPTPVNENDTGAFTGDQAEEAIQSIAPGAQITSAERTPQHNHAVGGVSDSMHLGDQARDVVLPEGMTAAQFRAQLQAHGYPITEFLDEGNHVHWGWGAKGNQAPGSDPWGAPQPVYVKGSFPPPSDADIAYFKAGGKQWVDSQGQPAKPYDATEQDYQEGDLDRASKFWGGVWQGVKGAIQGAPGMAKQMLAGAVQAVGENPQAFEGEAAGLAEYGRSLATPEQRAQYDKGMAETAALGKRIYADASADVKQYAPDASAPEQQKLAYQVTAGTIQMLPALTLGLATGDPVPAALAMGDQAFAQKYGEARAAGRTPQQAGMDATFDGIMNGSLGSVNVGLLMRPGSSFLSKTLQNAAGFGTISVATEALQIGYDWGLVNPNMTTHDALQRLEEAGITGVLQGAFLSAGEAGLHAAVNKFMSQKPPAPPRVEPAPAAVPPAPEPVAPTSRQPLGVPPAESNMGPLQAQVRAALGLERPGQPPTVPVEKPAAPVDGWGTPVPVDIPKAPAATASVVDSGGITRRIVAPDVAVTATGREVPVHYAVVEAGDLVPSQDQSGNANQNYPAELQPRDRTRAVSQAQIAGIAQNINPRLLDRSPNASDGAPIIAPSGVVESGNGRTLAVQRAYEQNLQSAYQYRNYLIDQGYPVEGMKAPMLVRVRSDPMTPEDRQAFVREANQAGQLGYSSTERAMSDAAAMPDSALDLYRGGEVDSAGNREFVRSFLDKALAPNELAGMVAPDGSLSQEAVRRVKGALLAKAYGDPDLVGAVTESQDNNIKAIGGALTDVAADWAKVRSAVARGDIPPEMDQTGNLLSAVKLVERARADGRNVAEFVNQKDIFSGEALDPDVESWLRLLFRNTKDWTQPAGRDKIADAIRLYAQEAQKALAGPSLLGGEPVKPSEILALAKARQYGEQQGNGPSLRFSEDLRALGEGGEQSRAEAAAAGRGQGAAQVGAPGRGPTVGEFGPEAGSFVLSGATPGTRVDLTHEARDYLVRAGVVDGTPFEKMGALANWVATRGKAFGFESFAGLTGHGDLAASTNGDRGAVTMPHDLLQRLATPGENIVTVHNHPSGSSFSGGDLATLAYPGHAGMMVVTHDGGWHVASLAAKFREGADFNTSAMLLKRAQEKARGLVTGWVDALYNSREVTGNEGNAIIHHAQMHALAQAGLIHYFGTDVIPERMREKVANVVKAVAEHVQRAVVETSKLHDLGVQLSGAGDAYRPAGPVQLAGGLEGVLEKAGRLSGFAGGARRAAPSPGRPQVYRKPFQPRLLEDENRYEAERPPFYSQLTRSVEDLKLNRAPSKDWLGVIDNLKTKGVKQEEIDWSGVKDWLGKQIGAVSKADVLQHLRENEVRVQEVERREGLAPIKRDEVAPDEQAQEAHKEEWDRLVEARRKIWDAMQERRHDPAKANELRVLDTEYQRLYNQMDQVHARMVDETVERLEAARGPEPKAVKYPSYALPGGNNYRELLLKLPDPSWMYGGRRDAPSAAAAAKVYLNGHWEEPNVLAHIRFDDRTGPNGERILHAAEVQSDWHQQGRKRGYAGERTPPVPNGWAVDVPSSRGPTPIHFETEAEAQEWQARTGVGGQVRQDFIPGVEKAGTVPQAPFKSSWHELAIKRLFRYAAEHGYDRLSWDTGDTNAARYDLGRQVESLIYKKQPDGKFALWYQERGRPDGRAQEMGTFVPEKLPDVVGKEVADKIVNDHGQRAGFYGEDKGKMKLSGLDLKVGGEGMRSFYDKILPAFVNKYVKKWGAKVDAGRVPTETKRRTYLGLQPTKEQILQVADAIHARPVDQRFVSPITGERQVYQINRASNEMTWRDVMKAMERGQTFAEAMAEHGSHDLSRLFGAEIGEETARGHEAVHQVEITPEMRRSVMEGQPLFEDKQRYETEPGALDAQGRPVEQTIIPGAERTQDQARAGMTERQRAEMKARMQQSKLRTGAPQEEAGGLFGTEAEKQGSLFSDERRYSDIPEGDREELEKAARTGNWIGRFNAKGATADARIRDAIGHAFEAWKRVATSVPDNVRRIFRDIGGTPTGFSDIPENDTGFVQRFTSGVKKAADQVFDIGNDLLMHVAPMSQGTNQARAIAKFFANGMRLARWHGNKMMEGLKKNFTHDQRRRMWEAADEESVLRQQGQPTEGRGLSVLSPAERQAVLEQQADAQNVWNAAKDLGMVKGEGLPSYVPRMVVEMAGGDIRRIGSSDSTRSIPGMGRNVRTSTPQMKQRKHLTTAETEQAAGSRFNTIANVVKDIRTLPLATMRLREAVAGRALINKIKEIGDHTGDETVVEGHMPADSPFKWFTMDHPAFYTWRPKFRLSNESGRYEPLKDQDGNIVFEKIPNYVRGDFEGPLRAIMSQESGKVYNALMSMKGRAMTAIMYSPLIHNMVEWGRALPAAPGKVLTGLVYFEGNRAKNDPMTMTEAIMHGLVPIGHRGGFQDAASIASEETVAPGRSWTAKILGAVPGLFSRGARDSVYRAVDAMGDLWHNTLLWDRVGDLQMGLYVNMRDSMVKKGMDPDAAQHIAAHFANRYAGALPLEAMSNMARKVANLMMFSRSYTLGNLGAMKDMVTGLPRDVQAQIEQSAGAEQLKSVRSYARRKAISIFLTDVALYYASISILASAVGYIAGREDLDKITKGYVDRFRGLMSKVGSPWQLLDPFADLQQLSETSENEAGRENRFLAGYDKDGTAIYGRATTGKIGEEFVNWTHSPIQTGLSKLSPLAKPTWQLIANDQGFGKHVYDPEAKGLSGLAQNLGNIVRLYFDDQIPLDSLKSGYDILKGNATKLDVYKTVGPLAGVTFSKGAPGGPAVGELYQLRREHDAQVSAAMPDIVQKIKSGDVAGARKDMRDLGMPQSEINYYVRTTLNPRLRLNTRSSRQLIRHAAPEERARIDAMRGEQ